jgi:hypothetical protein
MVKWHNHVGNGKRANWYTDAANAVEMQERRVSPGVPLLLDESLGYAVRIRARAARRFNARRSSSLRPPQTP